jgi:hypothetical protein
MTLIEANKIIDRLANGCIWHRFDEPGVQQEYQKMLMRYEYSKMNNAVDALLETDSKNVPPLSALVKAFKENRQTTAEVANSLHCDVCNDKGFALITEYVKNGNETLPYKYVLYCPFCTVGQSQAYNGNNCKDRKVNAVCEPLTKYYDEQAINEIRHANNHPHKLTDTEKETLRKTLVKIGLRMPIALDRGDAWEGDSDDDTCPF